MYVRCYYFIDLTLNTYDLLSYTYIYIIYETSTLKVKSDEHFVYVHTLFKIADFICYYKTHLPLFQKNLTQMRST